MKKLLLIFLFLSACATTPFKVTQVTPDIYRGPRPNAEQIQELKHEGFKSILNLETSGSAIIFEKSIAEPEIFVFSLPMSNYTRPTKAQLDDTFFLLQYLPPPIYVHCKFGHERTGIVIATYRVLAQKWSKEKAWQEALDMGFHYYPYYYFGWKDAIPESDSIAEEMQ